MTEHNIEWNKKVDTIKKELENMTYTLSYISCDNLTNTQYITTYKGYDMHKVVVKPGALIVYIPEEFEEIKLHEINEFLGYWYDLIAQHAILVQITKNKYLCIDKEVYTFEMTDRVEDFVVTMGNNDVPYPIIYGTKYLYFMHDMQYIERKYFSTPITIVNADALQKEYYKFDLDEPCYNYLYHSKIQKCHC